MNDKFDELAKGFAQSGTRRQALKEFGVGLAGIALACLGLVNKAEAAARHCKPPGAGCDPNKKVQCCSGSCGFNFKCY
jgi:hypothetical protein